jgi:uncharacterized protein YgiM (DUF1202 family)
MRAAPIMVGMILLGITSAASAQTAPTAATVSAPEAEVRAGPSDKFYVTGKLRQNERVTILEEMPGGWLKIKAPEGSYSWVCGRFLRFLTPNKVAVVESLAEAPVRIGSAAPDAEPTVEQVKLSRGAQVVVIGEPWKAPDGTVWWPIVPPEQEVRYVAKDSLRLTPTVETISGASPPVVAAESLWTQAEKAEQARDYNRAIQLYQQQAQQTADHDLQQRCYSRIQFLRDGSTAGSDPRFAPVPAYPTGPPPSQPVGFAPPRPPAPPMQASDPGYLRRAGFAIDGRPSYVLTDSSGRPLMYATGQQGLNLDLFVNQAVQLYGTISYRGDLRTNYVIVGQVRQLQ